MPGYVLVIGVDGVRFDLVGPESTPGLWGLGQAGFLVPVVLDDETPSWSGPSWATIATGTGVDGHGITANDLAGHRLADHPDFLTVATRSGLSTLLVVSGWPPLALTEDGGPLFAEVGRREFVAVKEVSLEAWDAADEAATELAAGILAGDAPRLSFVYLGAVDIYGHVAGSGEAYRAQALAADARVGRLLAAVRSRPGYDEEGWTIVAVTDHGHLDQGGHGGREPEVVTAWVAAAGPGIRPGGPPPVARQVDIAPLVLAALGVRRELAVRVAAHVDSRAVRPGGSARGP
ncbi:MAG TPA: alkaline phosphatase family protein [Streptosporangiaceae bacterium]|nr:alkaline phosphatase family protein [Streptosporangiaceae bacterium]